MNLKGLFILLFFTLAVGSITAAEEKSKSKEVKCTVTGEVLDKSNAEALTGATVKILELDLEAFVDFDGAFIIDNVPSGSYTIEISMVSYGTKRVENFQVEESTRKKRFFL